APVALVADHVDHRDQHQAEKERPDQQRLGGQQVANQLGEGQHTGQDSRPQHQQKGAVDLPPEAGRPGTEQHPQGGEIDALDGVQQLVVDPADKGDGAPGYAGHHIRGAHRHTLGKQQGQVALRRRLVGHLRTPLTRGTNLTLVITSSSKLLVSPMRWITRNSWAPSAPTGITRMPLAASWWSSCSGTCWGAAVPMMAS